MSSTDTEKYANRLKSIQGKTWKKYVFNPYKWHIRRVIEAPTLEVGCGIGRVLNFAPDRLEGVDHNRHSVEACKKLGLTAFYTEDFLDTHSAKQYRALLFSHILEHMNPDQAREILKTYLPHLEVGGRVIMICPQEVGYRSDETHVHFMDFDSLTKLCEACGLVVKQTYSFPFPRPVGKLFIYNEFVVIAEKPAAGAA
jgi:2-polyprenyl-3-methyl-5-hydroxy-6-metoxy-1,4-benzoquinol methylase